MTVNIPEEAPAVKTHRSWQARWVWLPDAPENPRNAWACFRGTFDLDGEGGPAMLHLTAETRYVAHLNGEVVARGPARSWPGDLTFDTVDVTRSLRPGRNVLAVLVLHEGVGTFQHLPGRAGLLAELEVAGRVVCASGPGWRASPHLGHDPRAGRMSVQLGFSERVDGRAFPGDWPNLGFDDTEWTPAADLGPAGMAPWGPLRPRDIPLLAERTLHPVRVATFAQVRPPGFSTVVDVSAHLLPGSALDATPVEFVALLATVLRLDAPGRVTLGFPLALTTVFGPLFLNGAEVTAWTGDDPGRFLTLDLAAGDHLLVMDVSDVDRGKGWHLGLDSSALDGPARLVSPLGEDAPTPFATLGPFDAQQVVDYQPFRTLRHDHPNFLAGLQARAADEFCTLGPRPVPSAFVSRSDVYVECVWTPQREARPIPADLQTGLPNGQGAELPLSSTLDTELVLDFGTETSGFLTLDVEAPAGTVLDLYGFEFLHPDGTRQDTHNLDNTLRYTCREGWQSYTSPVRRGFRYVLLAVRGGSGAVKLHGLTAREYTYPAPEVGDFRCSDELLSRAYAISRTTVRLCMEDTFVDCPAYEQAFWVGDSRNEALTAAALFGAEPLTARCLRLVPPSRVVTPFLLDQVPSSWRSVIPNWTFLWAIACREHAFRTGDGAFARELWPHVRGALEAHLGCLDARGLYAFTGWNLLDWAPMDQPREGVVTHQNLLLARALAEGAELARLAGDGAGAEWGEAQAESLAQAINAHLWSEDRGAYLDCLHADGQPSAVFSEQTQIVARLSPVPPAGRRARIDALLLDPPPDFVRAGSPFMSFFLYEALHALGAHERLLDDLRARYGLMLRHGATTCWEMYPGVENRANPELPTRSHCHAWSAAPAYILPTAILGVQALTPGWTVVEVRPNPAGLSWAQGRVPLPHGGQVEVIWETQGEHLDLTVSAPAGVRVEAHLPPGRRGTVRVIPLEAQA